MHVAQKHAIGLERVCGGFAVTTCIKQNLKRVA